MKKLLALILCVMMFVSVIPTMAFAAQTDAQIDAAAKQAAATQKRNAILAEQPTAYIPTLQTNVDNAKADVKVQQDAYDAAVAADKKASTPATKQAVNNAKATLDNANVVLASEQKAYNDAVTARNAWNSKMAAADVAVAEADLAVAQADLAAKKADGTAAYSDYQAVENAQTALATAQRRAASIPAGTTPAGTTPAGTTPAAAAAATYDTSKAVAKNDPKLKADLENAAAYKKQVEKMIENTKKNVATAYGALAMNQVVYASAKSMDDVIGGLVDQIADMLAGKTVNGHKMSSADVKAFKDAHKANVRSVIEDIVISEIKDNEYKYLDKDGKIDPLKYGQAVADAVNAALNNKDFQAGYQAVATYYAMMNVADSINEELKKQRDEFKDSIDTSFDKDFATNYSRLAAEYIDTLTETGSFDADNFPWTAYITPEVGKQS